MYQDLIKNNDSKLIPRYVAVLPFLLGLPGDNTNLPQYLLPDSRRYSSLYHCEGWYILLSGDILFADSYYHEGQGLEITEMIGFSSYYGASDHNLRNYQSW